MFAFNLGQNVGFQNFVEEHKSGHAESISESVNFGTGGPFLQREAEARIPELELRSVLYW